MSYVYKLTFSNGKSYIGITVKNPKTRYKDHKSNAQCGHRASVYCAWRKYGPPALTVLEEVSTNAELYAAEIRLIRDHGTLQPNGYNQLHGGTIPPMVSLGCHSDATRARISASLKGRPSPNKGRKASVETREKMRLAHVGRKYPSLTEEQKAHLSRINTGKTISDEARAKIGAAHRGRKLSQETKDKMSAGKKGKLRTDNGYRHPPEVMARIAETRRSRVYVFSQKQRDAVAESNRRRAKSHQTPADSRHGANSTGGI